MSYKKLDSEDASPSKSIAKSPSQSPIQSKSKLKAKSKSRAKPASKAETTASIKSQLEERKNEIKTRKQHMIEISPELSPNKTQSELDHDLALTIAKTDDFDHDILAQQGVISSDDGMGTNINYSVNSAFINPMDNNDANNIESSSSNKCGKNGINGLCILWHRGDIYTLIISPILLFCLLMIMLLANIELIIVWFLSGFIFYCLLIIAYFYGYTISGSILDLFTLTMIYGGCIGLIGWIFGWLLASTNNILVGPFMFIHSGFTLNSNANTILFSIVACIMYGGIFPFILIWMKCDKRMFDGCITNKCKIKHFYILNEYQQLQQTLNLQQHQMEQFMAQNEKDIMDKLNVAMKRLKIECISASVGYFGTIYIMSFILKFDEMDKVDTTLIFVMGYLLKDLIFAILFGLIAAYIIGRRKLYQITMNNKFIYYALIMLLGILQQVIPTILCGLYPHVQLRMTIIYVAIAVNFVISLIALIEVIHQKRLLKVQLDALFIYNSINALASKPNESSVRMHQLSISKQ